MYHKTPRHSFLSLSCLVIIHHHPFLHHLASRRFCYANAGAYNNNIGTGGLVSPLSFSRLPSLRLFLPNSENPVILSVGTRKTWHSTSHQHSHLACFRVRGSHPSLHLPKFSRMFFFPPSSVRDFAKPFLGCLNLLLIRLYPVGFACLVVSVGVTDFFHMMEFHCLCSFTCPVFVHRHN